MRIISDSSTGDFTYVHSNARAHRFNNGTMVLSDVEENDAGSYLCQASNGIAAGLSKIIHLEILGKKCILVPSSNIILFSLWVYL